MKNLHCTTHPQHRLETIDNSMNSNTNIELTNSFVGGTLTIVNNEIICPHCNLRHSALNDFAGELERLHEVERLW